MKDPTVLAIPFYFGTMGVEYAWLRKCDEKPAPPVVGYERRDTLASLTMGVVSLLAPLVLPRLVSGIVPGKGRYGKHLMGAAVAAAAATTLADQVSRRRPAGRLGRAARRVASTGGVVAVVAGGVATTTGWTEKTSMQNMWRRRLVQDLGSGARALVPAILGWDFIYYWNHRLMHESRFMWAIHVVHHSSERYNLSTALRQPVLEEFGAFVPYSLLALLGIRPGVINTARGLNLLYQYWIHTETVGKLGPLEWTLNTPSHHRVHHGSNSRYLDRNYGSILISWDKVFRSFEPESERVSYGLTQNIRTFKPWRIATHEHLAMLRDVARSDNWHDRLSFVLRGPGWATRRREQLARAGVVREVAGVAARDCSAAS